jgi:hypothetical protein
MNGGAEAGRRAVKQCVGSSFEKIKIFQLIVPGDRSQLGRFGASADGCRGSQSVSLNSVTFRHESFFSIYVNHPLVVTKKSAACDRTGYADRYKQPPRGLCPTVMDPWIPSLTTSGKSSRRLAENGRLFIDQGVGKFDENFSSSMHGRVMNGL